MYFPNTGIEAAPPLITTHWFNSETALSLEDFRGRVVVLLAFQMLCPGCVSRSIPLAQGLQQVFNADELAVIGLHTVFEHHDVMGPNALEAFIAEYRINFPVGVDKPASNGDTIPETMRAYDMQGTPTLVLIDAKGKRRAQYFGVHNELLLGANIGALLSGNGVIQNPADTIGCRV